MRCLAVLFMVMVLACIPAYVSAESALQCTTTSFGFQSGCGQITSPAPYTVVNAGDRVTVSVSFGCGASAQVFMSYALPDPVVVDGVTTTGIAGDVSIWNGFNPPPMWQAGAYVDNLAPGSHTITFTMSANTPTDCVQILSGEATGPWIILTTGGWWTTMIPFQTQRNPTPLSIDAGATTNPSNGAKPGGTVHYTISATTNKTANQITLFVPVPAGTSNPANMNPPPEASSATSLKWVFTNTWSAQVEFDVTVDELSKLKGINQIAANFSGQATFPDAPTAKDSVDVKTNVIKPTQITGKVYDVQVNFDKGLIVETNPEAGANVVLLDSNNATVDSATTNSGGSYSLDAPDAGAYTVQVSGPAKVYSRTDNAMDQQVTVTQQQSVTVASGSSGPTKVPDFLLPVSLVNYMASQIYGLNNLQIPLQGGIAQVSFPAMDTSDVLSALNQLVGENELMHPITDTDPADTDPWNAAIRLSEAMYLIQDRYNDVVKLGDDFCKLSSMVITAKIAGAINKALDTSITGAGTMSQLGIARIKSGLSGCVSGYLPTLLDKLGVTGQTNAVVKEVVSDVLKVGFDTCTNQWFSDATSTLLNALIRNGMLITITGLTMGAYTDATGYVHGLWQPVLDQALNSFKTGTYPLDKGQDFIDIENARSAAAREVIYTRAAEVSATQVYAVLDGLNGIRNQENSMFSLAEWTGETVQPSALAGTIGKFAPIIAVTAYAAVAVGWVTPLVEMYRQYSLLNTMVPECFNGVPKNGGGESMANSAASEEELQDRANAPSQAPFAQAAEQAYLAQLTAVGEALTANSTGSYAALRSTLATADSNLLDANLAPLNWRCLAALSAVTSTTGQNNVMNFLQQYSAASSALGSLYLQLELWAGNPSDVLVSTTHQSLQNAISAVKAVCTAAVLASSAVQGLTAPAYIQITEGTMPQTIAIGAEQEVQFTFTNVGDTDTVAATATLSEADGLLTVEGNAQFQIPALAPGQSAQATWTLSAQSTSTPGIATIDLLILGQNQTQSVQPNNFQDNFLVVPAN